MIALFVERGIEVFVTPWRTRDELLLTNFKHTEMGKLLHKDYEHPALYKCETKKIAFGAAVAVGIVVSAVGIRGLSLFIYPDQIEALTGWQASMFTTVDVLVTGMVIGGGADGIHKAVKVFTSFFDSTAATNEARRPNVAPTQ